MLHCHISTISDLTILKKSVKRPEEEIITYEKLCCPYMTPLGDALMQRFGKIEALSKVFKFSREATSHLGEWCADRVWFLALMDEEAMKVQRKIEKSFSTVNEDRPIQQLDAELACLQEAKEFISGWKFAQPASTGNSLSSKVLMLQQYLALTFEKPSNAKCIIFVKKRYTARLLAELFKQIGTEHLRMGLLVGTRYGDPGDIKFSFRQQVLTLSKFRKGEINCLVSLEHAASLFVMIRAKGRSWRPP